MNCHCLQLLPGASVLADFTFMNLVIYLVYGRDKIFDREGCTLLVLFL